jgi:hypothetical protein
MIVHTLQHGHRAGVCDQVVQPQRGWSPRGREYAAVEVKAHHLRHHVL